MVRVMAFSCWASSSTVSGWWWVRVVRATGGSWRTVLSISTRSRVLGPSPAASHLRTNLPCWAFWVRTAPRM